MSQRHLSREAWSDVDLAARRALIRELSGTTCRCGKAKGHGMSFCGTCWHSLPSEISGQLYRRIGEGFEEVYERACKFLKSKFPPCRSRRVNARPMRNAGKA